MSCWTCTGIVIGNASELQRLGLLLGQPLEEQAAGRAFAVHAETPHLEAYDRHAAPQHAALVDLDGGELEEEGELREHVARRSSGQAHPPVEAHRAPFVAESHVGLVEAHPVLPGDHLLARKRQEGQRPDRRLVHRDHQEVPGEQGALLGCGHEGLEAVDLVAEHRFLGNEAPRPGASAVAAQEAAQDESGETDPAGPDPIALDRRPRA